MILIEGIPLFYLELAVGQRLRKGAVGAWNQVSIPSEPVDNKTYNKTCTTSKDSDQPVHPPIIAMILSYPALDRLEAVEGTCDAQTDLRFCWSHKSFCKFCPALAHICFSRKCIYTGNTARVRADILGEN